MNPKTSKQVAFILVPVVLVVAIGGLWVLTDGSEQGSSPTGDIDFAPNKTLSTTPPFHLEGQIHYNVAPSQVGDSSFEDVMLCLYDSDGDVITSTNLGTFDGSAEHLDISITTERAPNLILVHHPRFYSIDGFQISVLEYKDGDDRFSELNYNRVSFPYDKVARGTCVPSP